VVVVVVLKGESRAILMMVTKGKTHHLFLPGVVVVLCFIIIKARGGGIIIVEVGTCGGGPWRVPIGAPCQPRPMVMLARTPLLLTAIIIIIIIIIHYYYYRYNLFPSPPTNPCIGTRIAHQPSIGQGAGTGRSGAIAACD